MMSDTHLILASGSPRRRELMERLGLPFEVRASPIEETFPSDLPADHVAEYIARNKALVFDFSELPSQTLIVACDTVVIIDDIVLGKPANAEEACAMLQQLSGRTHRVITGVCLRSIDKELVFSAKTEVSFRPLHKEEIEHYVETYKPLDKAGAYGIQEWIGLVGVERIEGSFYNVMGLPTQMLYTRLQTF